MQPARQLSKTEQHELFYKALASEIILLFLGEGNICRADFAARKEISHSTFKRRYFSATESHKIFMDLVNRQNFAFALIFTNTPLTISTTKLILAQNMHE